MNLYIFHAGRKLDKLVSQLSLDALASSVEATFELELMRLTTAVKVCVCECVCV